MKKSVLFFLFAVTLTFGQEYQLSSYIAEFSSSNLQTQDIYFSTRSLYPDYYVVNLKTLEVKNAEVPVIPAFSIDGSKKAYTLQGLTHVFDFGRGTEKIFDGDTLSASANVPFSPTGEYLPLGGYIYNLKTNSFSLVKNLFYPMRLQWSSDTTFIVLHQKETSLDYFLFEYSVTGNRKDTIIDFQNFNIGNCSWAFDAKRRKLYYSTMQATPTILKPAVHRYDLVTKLDTIIFSYPENKDSGCTLYAAGGRIKNMLWSDNYAKLAFTMDYILISSSDIHLYWPEENKITRMTDGCLHYGVKSNLCWGNYDTLTYINLTTGYLYAMQARGINGIDRGRINETPKNFTLNCYPNPFNASVVITMTSNTRLDGELSIYNILGQKVYAFPAINIQKGENRVIWNGTDNSKKSLPSGCYFAVMQGAGMDYTGQTLKLLYLK